MRKPLCLFLLISVGWWANTTSKGITLSSCQSTHEVNYLLTQETKESKADGKETTGQRPESAPAANRGKPFHIQLLVEISDDDSVDIIKSTRVSGEMSPRELLTSDYVYEVAAGDKILAVESLIADPFLIRGYPAGEEMVREKKHQVKRGDYAVLSFDLPGTNLDKYDPADLRVRLYQITGGTSNAKMTPKIFRQMKEQKSLTLLVEVPSKKLLSAIRAAMNNNSQ